MKTRNIRVLLRDGVMGAHLAVPDRTPAGAIIAIMEIWGVNDTIEHPICEVGRLHRPFMLHMAMKDRWVQAEVNDLLERRLAPNPLVTIHKYPGADPAFARHGGRAYSKPEADRSLALTVDFCKQHLVGARQRDLLEFTI